MTDQKLVDELEKALREEAYDGGFGYMGDEEFTAYVRGLAVTAAEAVEKAHTPTDGDRSSEQQEEQRHGDRGTDHEEQQTDDRAASGGLGVGGSHASSMPQAAPDGKRVISHTPTDDEREALREVLRETDLRGTWFDNGSCGHPDVPDRPGMRRMLPDSVEVFTAAILAAGFRRSEEPLVTERHDLVMPIYEDEAYDARLGDGDRDDPEPTRQLRECVICGEKVTMSNATGEWEKRHKHAEPSAGGYECCDVPGGPERCGDCPLDRGPSKAGPCARGDHETCRLVAGLGIGSCGCECHRSEPRGEPSDAQVEFPFTHDGVTLEQDDGGVCVSDSGGSSYWISPRVLAALRAAGEPQGEPSDAQVEAGCVAFYEDATGLTSWRRLVSFDAVLAERYRNGVRRALRAAGGVR